MSNIRPKTSGIPGAMTVKQLHAQDMMRLRAAEGWLELGDFVSASDELEEITAEARANPAVLSMRYQIYARARRWNMAVEVAEGLASMLPDKSENWINLAEATRQKTGGGAAEAKRIMLVAQVKFRREYLILFRLACYCTQLRQFDEAADWLRKAMLMDEKTVQRLAVDDPDLKPLWDSMSGTIWKME